MEGRQFPIDGIPDDFVVDDVISVDQKISERNDPSVILNTGQCMGVGFLQSVERFPDDLELSFDARPQKIVATVLFKGPAIDEADDLLRGNPHIFKMLA